MTKDQTLPQDRKLTVLYRVEPGCLGRDGEQHVDAFCEFARSRADALDADFVHWELEPRRNKSLAEMQYQVGGKNLNHDQAARYLAVFGKKLDDFEEHLHDSLIQWVEEYLGR